MSKFRTHYNNLKVEEDASVEDIRAAFKFYFLKFHPNKFIGNQQRAKIVMQFASEAYSVLSDPLKRTDYNLWIADHRQKNDQELISYSAPESVQKQENIPLGMPHSISSNRLFSWKLLVIVLVLVGLGYAAWLSFNDQITQNLHPIRPVETSNMSFGFVFENKCKHPITLVIRYKGLDNIWHFDEWEDVSSNELFSLEDESGKPLTSSSPLWYYYARTTIETGLEWKGKSHFTYSNRRLPMIEIEDVEGDNGWTISCD
jgi:hypothetical protein